MSLIIPLSSQSVSQTDETTTTTTATHASGKYSRSKCRAPLSFERHNETTTTHKKKNAHAHTHTHKTKNGQQKNKSPEYNKKNTQGKYCTLTNDKKETTNSFPVRSGGGGREGGGGVRVCGSPSHSETEFLVFCVIPLPDKVLRESCGDSSRKRKDQGERMDAEPLQQLVFLWWTNQPARQTDRTKNVKC